MRHEAIIRNLIEALKHICLVAKKSFDKLVLIHEGKNLLKVWLASVKTRGDNFLLLRYCRILVSNFCRLTEIFLLQFFDYYFGYKKGVII
jgi:hypothetical protein